MDASSDTREPATLDEQNERNNFPWGDSSAIDPDDSFRIVSNNVNGLRFDHAGGDIHYMCNQMDELHADVLCMQETQLDTRKTKV